jgi:hypothetical protein
MLPPPAKDTSAATGINCVESFSRAGGFTKGSDAGAELEHLSQHASPENFAEDAASQSHEAENTR